MMLQVKKSDGFTIVELLIVIVVIGLLAAITIVAYGGVQEKANNVRKMNDIQSVAKAIELYKSQNDIYPVTGTTASDVLSDSNCSVGTKQSQWVPGLVPEFIRSLPQSDGKQPNGSNSGCYKYWSNGTHFIVSAWVAAEGNTVDSGLYRRVGFREQAYGASEQYYCNHSGIGGVNASTGYALNNDRYKRSYTIASPTMPTNLLTGVCNEIPPSGA